MNRVRVLTATSPDLEPKLAEIQKLARQVFEPDIPDSQHHVSAPKSLQLQLDNWHQRLSADNAAILYIIGDPDPSASRTPNPPSAPILGFFFLNPRPLSESQTSLHIYLAAVHPSARGQGIFSMLLEETKMRAKAARFQILTVSTIPEKFQGMYGILSRAGSGWEVVQWEELPNGEGRKVVMKMVVE